MVEAAAKTPELPDIITLLAEHFKGNSLLQWLYRWEFVVYALLVVVVVSSLAHLATRKATDIPGRLQNIFEVLVGGLDDFVCGILGPSGRRYTPFIGTLFVYILCMNIFGLIPFLKPPTASWSTTLALALCVFFYVQYTALKYLGVRGYIDHLAGRPRGVLLWSIILPVFMFCLHVVTELLKPLSLSLRLRSNIWGDDLLLAVFAGLGLKGFPFLFFNMSLALMTALIQTLVFTLLSAIYFAIVLEHD